MVTTVKDGWHMCYGARVYVKKGNVIKAEDEYGYPLRPYYSVDYGHGWKSYSFPMKFSTVKRGIAKGTWVLVGKDELWF